MDTHINPDPDHEPYFSAALPPELRSADGLEEGVRDEAAPDATPGNAGEVAPATERPPRRRHRLLLGVSAVALIGLAGTAFLVSSDNRVHPVPRLAAAMRNFSDQAGFKKPPVLAPSASLAGINATLPPPETHPAYRPSSRDVQLSEVLGFHALEPGAPPAKQQTSSTPQASGASPAPGTTQTPSASAAPDPGPPPGHVPAEPGMAAATGAVGSPPPADLTASVLTTMGQGKPPELAADSPAAAATAAGRPQAAPASAQAPAQASSATPSASLPAAGSATGPNPESRDVLATALVLTAGPMTPAEQVDVLQTVTRLAALVRDQKRAVAELRADVAKANADTAARLEDFSRRLTLAEARTALVSAEGPATADSAAAPVAASSAASDSVAAAAPAAPPPRPGVNVTQVSVTTAPASTNSEPHRYRVQAASPGLAMLAEVDRGGGDGAQLQVTVGDDLPGYGKVKSVSQRGTSWVVTTEHGVIAQ